MDNIQEPNANFPFDKLSFVSPVPVPGGNHFIRCFSNGQQKPLYLQPPKCKIKTGIVKAGKRMYCDLIFCHDDETFIEWIDQFETICQDRIYENRDKWFESTLEKHDIENSFSPTMKLYKSGKLYTMRVNIPVRLGKCGLKIYNEQEEDDDGQLSPGPDSPTDEDQPQTQELAMCPVCNIGCNNKHALLLLSLIHI